MKSYVVDVACVNCGHIEFKVRIHKGNTITDARCTNCECQTLNLLPKPIFGSEEDKLMYATKMKEVAKILCSTKKKEKKFLLDAGVTSEVISRIGFKT